VSGRRMLAHTWLVTALNPKSIVFFVAFLPQFIDPIRPLLPQLLIMEITFVALATLNATAYAGLAQSARRLIRTPTIQRTVNRTGGSLLIGAGLLTATLRRAGS
jgi:threonine/homoserine/homoserine lactone efflux protein